MKQDNHGLAKSGFMLRVDGLLPEPVIKKAKRLIKTGNYTSWAIAKITGLTKEQVQDLRRGSTIPCKAVEKPIKCTLEIPDRTREIRIMDIAKRVRHPNLREIDSVSAGVNVYIGVVL